MAGIDKTYTDSYKEYKEFKDWADKQVVTFFDGYEKCIGDWVWTYEPEDFNNGEIPIMNTPYWLDAYLIQQCKIEFVSERMKYVYDEKTYNEYKKYDFSKIPDGYQQNRKIKVKCVKKGFPIHNKPYNGKSKYWWLQGKSYNYNEETNTWSHIDILYPYNTNTGYSTSIKSTIRHLRKQYLPKGAKFRLIGNYIGESYIIEVK